MKNLIRFIFSVCFIVFIYLAAINVVTTTSEKSVKIVKDITNKNLQKSEAIQKELKIADEKNRLTQQKNKEEIYKSERIKVLIKAKDVRTCMKKMNTNTIDNTVIECNKDHYTEMKREEAENLERLN